MPKTAVILQPSYIPWRGYFDLIRRSDVFVFYDDVQYDKHGWRNRNRIKTPSGLQWLTIPVHAKGNVSDGIPISNIGIDDKKDWRGKHLETIRHAYRRSPYFSSIFELLREILDYQSDSLCDYTISTTTAIARLLGLRAAFVRASSLRAQGGQTERLVSILRAIGADHYVSGPSARAYLDPEAFNVAGITFDYIDYRYAPYAQLHGAFEPSVSIVDLLMMTGPDAPLHLVPVA
jgi:hypothetical protein